MKKLVDKDLGLYERLMKDIHIISSSVKRFNIFISDDEGLTIEIDFELLYDLGSVLRVRFKRVKEYSFYWNSTHNFYYVERFKLIRKTDLFYLSLDPEDESSLDISENDQDFILFSGFEAWYV